MDFGVMDTSTCTPLNNAFVEIWHGEPPCASRHLLLLTTILPLANATGSYGAYGGADFNSSETWLRGGWHTDSSGIVELTTLYPGFYTGRTPHIHIMVRTNWTESANGFVDIVSSICADTQPDALPQHARISLRKPRACWTNIP